MIYSAMMSSNRDATGPTKKETFNLGSSSKFLTSNCNVVYRLVNFARRQVSIRTNMNDG